MTRYLNGRPDRSPDLMIGGEALPADRYLLCSDGLSSIVPAEHIHAALESGDDLAQIVRQLNHPANSDGGLGNTTALLIDVLPYESGTSLLPIALGSVAD